MGSKITTLLFLASIFAFCFLPVKDVDFGWHYRCGKEFLDSGLLCATNRFSYFLSDYKAFNPSFLYDIALAFIYNNFGFLGVSFLGALMFSFAAHLLYKTFKGDASLRLIAVYSTFLISGTTFTLGLRSQIATYLFFVLTLFIIHSAKYKKFRYLFSMPAIMAIWANAHIGFFIGLILLFIFLIDSLVEGRNRLIVGLIFAASFLAAGFNPFGFKVYFEIWRHAWAPLNATIAEWVEPLFWQRVLIAMLSVLSFGLILKQKSLRIFSLLILILFAVIALKARRNIPLFFTVYFYILLLNVGLIAENVKKKGLYNSYKFVSFSISIFLFLLFMLAAASHIKDAITLSRSWEAYCKRGGYPCRAISSYKKLSGNVYSAYEWGGFLIWQKPKIKVFADGRMPAWKDKDGKSAYQAYLYIIQARDGWNEKLRSLKTDFILISNGTFLDLLLQKDAAKYEWKQEYRDKAFTIYKNASS